MHQPTPAPFAVLLSVDDSLMIEDCQTSTTEAAEDALRRVSVAANIWSPGLAPGIDAMIASLVACEVTWLAQVALLKRTVDAWTPEAGARR
jgi:hypothetical protein